MVSICFSSCPFHRQYLFVLLTVRYDMGDKLGYISQNKRLTNLVLLFGLRIQSSLKFHFYVFQLSNALRLTIFSKEVTITQEENNSLRGRNATITVLNTISARLTLPSLLTNFYFC